MEQRLVSLESQAEKLTQKMSIQESTSETKPSETSPPSEASDLFAKQLISCAHNPSNMQAIQLKQADTYFRMKQTNSSLAKVNQKLAGELPLVQKEFQIHQYMLKEMKSDLEFITKALVDVRKKLGLPEPERKEDDEVDLDEEVLQNYSNEASKLKLTAHDMSLLEEGETGEHDDIDADDMMQYVN